MTQSHKLPPKGCLDLGFAGIMLPRWHWANRERTATCQLYMGRLETRPAKRHDSEWPFLFACRIIWGRGRGWPGPWTIPRKIGAFPAIPRLLLPFRAAAAWRHLRPRLATGPDPRAAAVEAANHHLLK